MASARWVLSAVAAVLCLAAVCIYGAICLLFWLGQWQMVFEPSHAITTTPESAGLAYENIEFDVARTGISQLAGWWIPAGPDGRYAGDTILFLRDGSGSLSGSVDQLKALHALGINLFAFDYRGFGDSFKLHPSEKSTLEDAGAAWNYLTGTRHLAPGSIAIYGVGLGAAVAAETALRHPQSPALILEDLQPPVLDRIEKNPRTRFLPVRLLFHDRFDPTRALARLSTPKLFLNASQASASGVKRIAPLYYHGAAEPKTSEVLTSTGAPSASGAPIYNDPAYLVSLRRFLDASLSAH